VIETNIACAVPDTPLIELLAEASDAPMLPNGDPKRSALPTFFRSWSRVAWGDLLRSFPDEDGVELSKYGQAREEFFRLVTAAMLTEIAEELEATVQMTSSATAATRSRASLRPTRSDPRDTSGCQDDEDLYDLGPGWPPPGADNVLKFLAMDG
jgi:hypothetical protein